LLSVSSTLLPLPDLAALSISRKSPEKSPSSGLCSRERGGRRRWSFVRAVAETVTVHVSSWELASAFMVPGKVRLDLLLNFPNFPPSPPPPTASPVSTFSVSVEFS
jgi:hypothetical protein